MYRMELAMKPITLTWQTHQPQHSLWETQIRTTTLPYKHRLHENSTRSLLKCCMFVICHVRTCVCSVLLVVSRVCSVLFRWSIIKDYTSASITKVQRSHVEKCRMCKKCLSCKGSVYKRETTRQFLQQHKQRRNCQSNREFKKQQNQQNIRRISRKQLELKNVAD